MCSLRLVALLACIACSAALDSEGTDFVFAFVRNANPDITNQALSVTVLNRNTQACNFTLTYRPDYHKSTPPQTSTSNLLSMTSTEISIPSWYGFNYTADGPQDDVYLTLLASSSCPVTLLANNFDKITKQGDTFMVLPTTWGSKSFTFSLPPSVLSAVRQYEQVFVLPVGPGSVNVQFFEIGNAASQFSLNITYGNTPAVYVGARTSDNRPRTYHVIADGPVLIVAGVTCAGRDPSNCDHVAYMPHPQAASDCYSYDYYDDDHLSYLPTTSQFFTDIPGSCLVGQDITATFSDSTSRTITIKPQMESPLWSPATTGNNENGVAFHNGGSNIHIARYFDGTYKSTTGAFISTSPSITQFHNDYSAFSTRNVNDNVEIFCTVLACSALKLDNNPVYSPTTVKTTQKVDGVTYYIFVIQVPTAGFHQLDLNPTNTGNYAFFVYGKNGKYSYGYGGGVNKPKVVLAPATTGSPATTGTGTQPIVTTPTTAAPPVTSPTTPIVITGSPSTSKPTSASSTVTTPVVTQSTITSSSLGPTSVKTSPASSATPVITTPSTQPSSPPSPTTQTTPKVVTTPTASTTTATNPTSPSTSASPITVVTTPTITTPQAPTSSPSTPTPTSTPLKTTTKNVDSTVSSTQQATTTSASTGNPSTSTVPVTTTTPIPGPTTSVATASASTSTVPVPSPSTTVPVVTSTTTTPPVTTTTTKATAPPVTTTTTQPTPVPTTKPTAAPVTTPTTPTTPTTSTIVTTTQSGSQFGVILPVVFSLLFIFF